MCLVYLYIYIYNIQSCIVMCISAVSICLYILSINDVLMSYDMLYDDLCTFLGANDFMQLRFGVYWKPHLPS